MGPAPRTDVPGIKRVAASEILELRLAFLGGRPREGRLRTLLASLFPQGLDPPLRIRGDERLPARLPDEDLLPQFFPQAVEFLVHLPFLPAGAVEVGFVPRVLRHQHHDATCRAAPGPTPALDRADLRGNGFVEDDEVDLRDVEALLPDRGRDDDVHLAVPELLEDLDLFLLRQPDIVPAGGLPDEADRTDPREARELLRHAVRGLPVVCEDDHLGIGFPHELLADDPLGLGDQLDRKSTRLNSSHRTISYAVFCLKKKKK